MSHSGVILIKPVDTSLPEGLREGNLWHLRWIGRDGLPMGLSGAVFQVTPLLHFAAANPGYRFRFAIDEFTNAGLLGRYYAPFFRAAPANLIVPDEWACFCPRIEQPVRLLIAGSRDFSESDRVNHPPPNLTVLVGACKNRPG